MPHRLWSHHCCGIGQCGPEPVCAEHKKRGVFAGWWPRPTERNVRYIRVHGLAHKGAHLELADRVFGPLRDRCPACRGSGWVGAEDDTEPLACPGCAETGVIWRHPPEEIAAAREIVLRAFPEARTRWSADLRLVEGA